MLIVEFAVEAGALVRFQALAALPFAVCIAAGQAACHFHLLLLLALQFYPCCSRRTVDAGGDGVIGATELFRLFEKLGNPVR